MYFLHFHFLDLLFFSYGEEMQFWARNIARASSGYHCGFGVYLGFGEDGLVPGGFANT